MPQNYLYQQQLKCFSVSEYQAADLTSYRNVDEIEEYRVCYVTGKNNQVTIDFSTFNCSSPTLFFLGPKQEFIMKGSGDSQLSIIAFSQDFYCIDKHDKEVSCYGFLFANMVHPPKVILSSSLEARIKAIIESLKSELQEPLAVQEDMLKLLLKQLLIISVRIKRAEEEITEENYATEFDLIRSFNQLIDKEYKNHHGVAFYAEQLNYVPKTFSKKVKQLSQKSPLEMIKEKLIIESKRMMIYENQSIKEIAFSLGFEDVAYFSRFFKKNVGLSPSDFKKSL